MTIIYTLLGVPYVAVIDPVRGVVLQKAARKRIPSPGQMSLFGSNDPKEGDTKVENGVTYRLNQHSRWERTDKAKGKSRAKAKAVVPVVEEKAESKAKAKSKSSDVADMRQKGDTGSRRDGKPAMQTQHFSSYDEVKAGLFERISFPVRINKNRNETFSIYPHPRGADKYWSQTELLELANVLRSVGVNPPRLEKSWDDYIEKIKAGPNKGGYIPHNDGFTYMSLGQPPTPAASQAEPEAMPVDEPDDLDQPEDLPQPTIGDMLAEEKAEEEPGGMEVQGIAVEQGSNGLTTNPETFKDDWARLKELESDGIAKRVGTGLTYKIPGYTFVNKEIYKTDPNTYRQTAVNWFAVMPDKSSAQETRKASAKTQESLPKETRGGDGRKMISTAGAASALAEAVNGRLWQKKEGEIRIYVSGTNNGYLRISPETDSTSQVQYFMKSYDIPKVEEAVNAFNREYQITNIEDKKTKEKVLMQENEDGVIAPAGQHEPDTYITREWYE